MLSARADIVIVVPTLGLSQPSLQLRQMIGKNMPRVRHEARQRVACVPVLDNSQPPIVRAQLGENVTEGENPKAGDIVLEHLPTVET